MENTSHAAVLALSAAVEDAANLLRVPTSEIKVESLEAREWPDGCLGLGNDTEACTDAVTPGFLIMLGDGFRYRTDMQGNIRAESGSVDTELMIRFVQTGGIGGWTSEYQADDSTLTASDAAEIRRFIEESNFFDLPSEVPNGQPLHDMYDYTLTVAHGRRNHTVHTYDGSGPNESPELARFIGWLKERLPAPGPSI
jgi:hypothetical protein